MAYTQADIDTLKAAIAALASGTATRRVRYSDGSEAEYVPASLPMMKDVLAMMQNDVNATAGTKPIRRVVVLTTKGTY